SLSTRISSPIDSEPAPGFVHRISSSAVSFVYRFPIAVPSANAGSSGSLAGGSSPNGTIGCPPQRRSMSSSPGRTTITSVSHTGLRNREPGVSLIRNHDLVIRDRSSQRIVRRRERRYRMPRGTLRNRWGAVEDEGVLDPRVVEWFEANPMMSEPFEDFSPEMLALARSPVGGPPTRAVARVADDVVDGIPVRIYEHDHPPAGLGVYFHGGGFCS